MCQEKMKKIINGRPLHERVIVKDDEVASVTKGGLILPDDAKETVSTATVIAVGNLANRQGENLNPGDRIIMLKHAGMPIIVDGVNYRLVLCNDIIFVYDPVE